MERRCLLGVFAHPDDEVVMAGAFRRYHDAGVHTALLCATRGEAGEISDPALARPETLGQVREAELREAARIMGIADLAFLGYHDGQLAAADPVEATERIVRHMRRLRPQVVVTFDANGGYGHRDHMAIHLLATAAFQQAGDAAAFPAHLAEGLEPYAPQKLYYLAFPRGLMQRLWAGARREQQEFRPFGSVTALSTEEMGTADERITTTLPLDDALYAVREAAQQAHRTQQNPRGPFATIPPEVLREVWGTQYFVRAVPPPEPGEVIEHDLFAGVV